MSEKNRTMQDVKNNESYLLSVVLVTGASTFIKKIQQMPPGADPKDLRKVMNIYISHLEELYRQTS